MEEARNVLTRLERIDRLDRAAVEPAELLAELRGLLADAEAWLCAEGGDVARARAALDGCRAAMEEVVPASVGRYA
jgi:hypothetical protein